MSTGTDQTLATLARVDAYIETLVGGEDDALRAARASMAAAKLPAINVSPNQGKLLYLLARIAGARRILEVGTLGGYSAIWLARALPSDGRLITLEIEERHARVARENLARAGLADRVEVRLGSARETMQALVDAGTEPFDLIFIDADKPGYVEYLEWALRLSRPGTVILADNVVQGGAVTEAHSERESVQAIQRFNQAVAANPRLEALIVPLLREHIDGVAIIRVREE